MKLKLNLENFENIEFKAPDLPVMEQYRYFLERLHEWEQVTGNVKRLIKNIEKILEGKVEKSVEVLRQDSAAPGKTARSGSTPQTDSKSLPTVRKSSPGFGDYKDESLNKLAESFEDDPEMRPLPVIKTVNPITEEVTMDLKGVTGMAQTPKAILVTKMGLQKWIPLSCLILEEDTLKADGTYYDELKLLKGKSWILDKPWDKLEVRKS